jgi:hypothetical protein
MLKKSLLALAIISPLSLTSCGGGGITPEQMQKIYDQVVPAAIQYCKFEVDYDSVAAMVAAYNLSYGAAVQSIGAMSKYICETVTAMGPREASPDGTQKWTMDINGKKVEITGSFKE